MSLHLVRVAAERPYDVRVGAGALARLPELLGDRAAFVVVDAEVERLHGDRLGLGADVPRLVVPPGESSKSLRALEDLLERIADAGLGRDGVLVTYGGGVVCDLGGLAAALFARGIDHVACPTTLLAQVDASVGGKTAVNLRAGKNLAGAFHAPREVLADVAVLATLPRAEWRSGLGELVKTAIIDGGALLDLLEAEARSTPWDAELTARLVALAVEAKATIVAQDEREAGPREALNLGHTFAHAIEHTAGFGRVPHGIAVAAGIQLALQTAEDLDLPVVPGFAARVTGLLAALELPQGLAALSEEFRLELAPETLVRAMRADKKRRAGETRLVLPLGPGTIRCGMPAEEALLRDLLTRALS